MLAALPARLGVLPGAGMTAAERECLQEDGRACAEIWGWAKSILAVR